MTTRSAPVIVYSVAIGLLVTNLAITFGTLSMDFIPSRFSLLLGVAYGAACAAYFVGAAGFAEARLPTLGESQRRMLAGSLTTRIIGVVAVVQLGFGTAAFINGVAGVSTWMFGRESVVPFTVREAGRVDLVRAPRWFEMRDPCSRYELDELTNWQNAFNPCLAQKFEPGARLTFRGHSSVLGLWIRSLPPQPDSEPQLAQTLDY